jgi:phytanoyl-CoA hydroxylase
MHLTTDQIAAYHRDGFVILGRILDDRALDEIRADEAALRGALPSGDMTSTHFWCLMQRTCPGVRRTATSGPQVEAAASIIGPDVALWWNQFVTKMPDGDAVRGEFTWHQDNGYADVSPGTNVTVWTALDDVTTVNGCVWVVPGSHRSGLLPHNKPRADSWHLQVPVEGMGIPVELKAGEGVLFSGYTLHRSLANRSQAPRRAVFMQYAHADARLPTRGNAAVADHPDAWIVAGRSRVPLPPAPAPQ